MAEAVAPAAGQSQASALVSTDYGALTWERPKAPFWQKDWFLFILFMFPNLFLLTLFTFKPAVQNLFISFQRVNLLNSKSRWIGLDNYKYIFNHPTFQQVLWNTLYFTAATLVGVLVLGLLVALLLNQKLRFRDGARAVVFAPYLLSGAAIGIVWAYIFDPRFGLLAQILGWVGISSPNWLNDPNWAMPAIIIVYVWKNLGFAATIFLAGLQAIPQDLYEAAKLDGANAWWRFRSVTLPMLSPISFFLLVTTVLGTFQAFDIQRVMTQGGPAYATTTLVYYVYDQGFGNAANYGRSAAAAMTLFAAMLTITIIQFRASRNQVHYDG
jgi:multiple sugar transport system permease protein/sn-glycerol 3-phosphate transport system permease protein